MDYPIQSIMSSMAESKVTGIIKSLNALEEAEGDLARAILLLTTG